MGIVLSIAMSNHMLKKNKRKKNKKKIKKITSASKINKKYNTKVYGKDFFEIV
tara:strand:+ start:2830 stop:2988 length:159 start_codon:yes stop_codon:yes gene_type:complete